MSSTLEPAIWSCKAVLQEKLTRSPEVPNYEIQGTKHKACMKKVSLSDRPKAKVSRLRHPGTLRAQPWSCDTGHVILVSGYLDLTAVN